MARDETKSANTHRSFGGGAWHSGFMAIWSAFHVPMWRSNLSPGRQELHPNQPFARHTNTATRGQFGEPGRLNLAAGLDEPLSYT